MANRIYSLIQSNENGLDSNVYLGPGENVMEAMLKQSEKQKFKKSFYYWSSQFQLFMEENVVIFSAYEENMFIQLDIKEIMYQLNALNLLTSLKAVYQLTNAKFFYLQFESPINAAAFQNKSSQINNKLIKFVKWDADNKNIKITLDKIPAKTIKLLIPEALSKWGTVVEIIPEGFSLPNGSFCETGQTQVLFQLNDESTIDDIPYFISLGQVKVYVHIRDRPRICFRCRSLEHLVTQCPLKYCGKCRSLKPKMHTCRSTYASKTINSMTNWKDIFKCMQDDENLEDFPSLEGSTDGISLGIGNIPKTSMSDKGVREVEKSGVWKILDDEESQVEVAVRSQQDSRQSVGQFDSMKSVVKEKAGILSVSQGVEQQKQLTSMSSSVGVFPQMQLQETAVGNVLGKKKKKKKIKKQRDGDNPTREYKLRSRLATTAGKNNADSGDKTGIKRSRSTSTNGQNSSTDGKDMEYESEGGSWSKE